MMMRSKFLLLCMLGFTLLIGCSKGRPADMPKVAPVSLTLMDGGSPLADATVLFISENPVNSITVGGTSDSSGVVALYTTLGTFSDKGAPTGKYKITVQKDHPIVQTKTDEELKAMGPGEIAAHSRKLMAERDAKPKLVPLKLTKSSTTPLTIDVAEKDTSLTIDLAEYK